MLMASFGHSGSQTSQLMHSSVMSKAMISTYLQGDIAPYFARNAAYSPLGGPPICCTLDCNQRSTDGNTNLLTSPPMMAISRTIVPEMNWYWSDGVRNRVST